MIKYLQFWIFICTIYSYSYGQKEVKYVKSTELTRLDYNNESSGRYPSKVIYDRKSINQSLYKTIYYNIDSSLYSYSLEYYNEGENLDTYESISIYYAFDDEAEPYYGIYHSLLDTASFTKNSISIQKKRGKLGSNSDLEIEYLSTYNDLSESYSIPEHIIEEYLDWILNDVEHLDSLEIPNWTDSLDFTLRKTRKRFNEVTENGEMSLSKSYWIDKHIADSVITIDTVLITEHYSDLISSESETRSINETRTDSSIHHEEYFFYPKIDSTSQISFDLLHGDTLFRMFLSTVILDDTLYSFYKIKGNHDLESVYNKFSEYPEILEREISIRRDSLGFVIDGSASGIVVDEQLGNQEVSCKLIIREEEKPFKLKRIYKSNSYPQKINIQHGTKWYTHDYDLVSMYPNLDLRPLVDIKIICTDNTMSEVNRNIYGIVFTKQKKTKSKNSKYIPDYKRTGKRVEVNKKLKYEKWVDKHGDLFYEVFYY